MDFDAERSGSPIVQSGDLEKAVRFSWELLSEDINIFYLED